LVRPLPASARLPFETLVARLRAIGEETRLRILALLADGELSVSDLTDILRQSQPRVSRHLKLLVEAELVERTREGSWAFFRLSPDEATARFVGDLVRTLDPADTVRQRDLARREAVRAERATAAQDYFRRIAGQWDAIRSLHVPDEAVEQAIRDVLAERPFRSLLDLGTGTGRILEFFAPVIERGLGIDLSPAMLAVARANLEHAGIRHCTVRQGDIYDLALGRDSFDVVILHQVLHFLEDGVRAIREAASVLRPGGRLVIVDFAPHELEFLRDQHAHRRLGFARETVEQWVAACGLTPSAFRTLDAPADAAAGKLQVAIWTATDPRMLVADEPGAASPLRQEPREIA
jgi:ubiquinone/menaquinone biosynthesis C-methylase UbiE/DNA-binding transcriptional ArsR family regulator